MSDVADRYRVFTYLDDVRQRLHDLADARQRGPSLHWLIDTVLRLAPEDEEFDLDELPDSAIDELLDLLYGVAAEHSLPWADEYAAGRRALGVLRYRAVLARTAYELCGHDGLSEDDAFGLALEAVRCCYGDADELSRLGAILTASPTRPLIAAITLVRAHPEQFGLQDNSLKAAKAYVCAQDDGWWRRHMVDILQGTA